MKRGKGKNEDVLEVIDGGETTCGGIRRCWDSGLPKVIESNEITSFSLDFSLVSYVMKEEEDKGFNGYFRLKCEKKDGQVIGKYEKTKSFDGKINETFTADDSFLAELDEIIKEEDLVRFNGYTSHRAGLPEMFGNILDIKYASGESLYTSNNQDIDLPFSALKKIKKLFDKGLKNSKTQTVTESKDKSEDEPEDFDAGWLCECGKVNTPGTKFCCECGLPKPGVDPIGECICGLKFLGSGIPEVCPLCGEKLK